MQVREGRDRIAYVDDETTYKVAKSEAGLKANMIEEELADAFSEFVVPTIVKASGLVSAQPTVPIVDLEFRLMWGCMPTQIASRYSGSFAHNFEKPGNLGIHQGNIKFTDAGSLVLALIMIRFPEELADGLNAIGDLNRAKMLE